MIEHGEGSDENGSYWYDRYSDGWIEQGGSVGWHGEIIQKSCLVVFPIEFSDLKYSLSIVSAGEQNAYGYASGILPSTKTTTGFTHIGIHDNADEFNSFDWRACGYALTN